MGNGTNNRRAGIIYVKVDGRQYDAKGAYTYNLASPSGMPSSAPTACTATRRRRRWPSSKGPSRTATIWIWPRW